MAYLLDTDSASLAFGSNERLRARIRQTPGVHLSSIAAEERVRGVFNVIQKNRDTPGLPAAHVFLVRLLSDISGYAIHPYDELAARVFASFPASVRRIGTQDCRIAASAIAASWIVVTANLKDFSRIPGVQFEDWSR